MIKIKLFLLSMLTFTISTVVAQGYEAALFVGANFSQIDGDQFGGYNKLGANIGFGISRKIKEPWRVSFEMLYTQKGSKKVLDPDLVDPSLVINYHYIEVPLLAKYNLNDFQIYGGPSIGLVVFNQREDNGFKSKEDELNKTEVAFHLGATYYFTERLGIDIRHSYSLLSVRDTKIMVIGPTWFGRAGWYNRLFTVGLRLNLGS